MLRRLRLLVQGRCCACAIHFGARWLAADLEGGAQVSHMSARRLVSKTTVSYSIALSAGAACIHC